MERKLAGAAKLPSIMLVTTTIAISSRKIPRFLNRTAARLWFSVV
jgi:hypothetical protein